MGVKKEVNGITKKEVKLTQSILSIYNFDVKEDMVVLPYDKYEYKEKMDECIIFGDAKKIVPLYIQNKLQIMIRAGISRFDPNTEVLFRPIISKSICDYLLERLYYIKANINIYLGEDERRNYTIRITDKEGNSLSCETNKNYKKCVIQSIFNINYYDKQDYCNKIRKILEEL